MMESDEIMNGIVEYVLGMIPTSVSNWIDKWVQPSEVYTPTDIFEREDLVERKY